MRAVIPVAGLGSRLRPHTYYLPKVLLNVAGKPILSHILDSLITSGITKLTIITGPYTDEVERFVRNNYSVEVEFVQQNEALGLGHAIWCASPTFNDEPILIVLGDTIFDTNLDEIIKTGKSTIGIHPVDNPSRFGVVITDTEGIIEQLVEKPELPISNLAIVGLYLIKETKLLIESLNELLQKNIQTRGEFQLTDALQLMISKGVKFATYHVERWFDCGKPETLLETNQLLLQRHSHHRKLPDCVVIPPVYIADDAIVQRSVIGPYTTIASGATVLDSVVRNSIISNNARVESYLLDKSIIGNNALVRGHFLSFNVGHFSEINIK
jgi:glucose-1-phosphate thymidylyltransferase